MVSFVFVSDKSMIVKVMPLVLLIFERQKRDLIANKIKIASDFENERIFGKVSKSQGKKKASKSQIYG
jgi:hypothetical protein